MIANSGPGPQSVLNKFILKTTGEWSDFYPGIMLHFLAQLHKLSDNKESSSRQKTLLLFLLECHVYCFLSFFYPNVYKVKMLIIKWKIFLHYTCVKCFNFFLSFDGSCTVLKSPSYDIWTFLHVLYIML